MASSRPLVCVFLKLPPSHRSILRIHKIAWNIFLPQLIRLNNAFEATQGKHASPEAKKIWLDMRRISAEKMDKLESVAFMNHSTAFGFLKFLDALHTGRDGSEAYDNFRDNSYRAFNEAGQAQDVLLKFREDIRVAVGRITTILSKDNNEISSFVTESSQSLLELATGIEECNAILEEHREEVKEVQRQGFDEKDNRPSEEEFQMVREKWQAFMEISEPPCMHGKLLGVKWEDAMTREIRIWHLLTTRIQQRPPISIPRRATKFHPGEGSSGVSRRGVD